MIREIIKRPDLAPPPPFYSPAVRVDSMVFVSGQTARDRTGAIVGKGDLAAQTRQTLENMRALLRQAGSDLRDVVKLTVYLTDMSLAPTAWAVRTEYLGANPPASTAVQVTRLGDADLLIEIDAIAVIGSGHEPKS